MMGSSQPPPDSPYSKSSVSHEKIKRPPSPLFPYPLSPTESSQESQNTVNFFSRDISDSPRTIYDSPPLPPRSNWFTERDNGHNQPYRERCLSLSSSPRLTSISPTIYSTQSYEVNQRAMKRASTPVRSTTVISHRKPLPQPHQRPTSLQFNDDDTPLIAYKTLKVENSSFSEYRKTPNHNKPLPKIPRKSSLSISHTSGADKQCTSGSTLLEQVQDTSTPKSSPTHFRHSYTEAYTHTLSKATPSPEPYSFSKRTSRAEREPISQLDNSNSLMDTVASPSPQLAEDAMSTRRHNSLFRHPRLSVKTESLRKISLPELGQKFHGIDLDQENTDNKPKPLSELDKLRNIAELKPALAEIKAILESTDSIPTSLGSSPSKINRETVDTREVRKDSDSDTSSNGYMGPSVGLDEALLVSDLSSDELSLSTSFCDKELKELDGISSLHAESTMFQLEENENEISTVSEDSTISEDLEIDSRDSSLDLTAKEFDPSKEPSRKSAEVSRDKLRCWMNTVPPDITENMSEKDIKRQEIIFETIYTEEEYLADLKLIEKVFIIPLKEQEIIEESRVDTFVQDIFSNVKELELVHSRIVEALVARQSASSIVEEIGDIYLCEIKSLEAYLEYGSNLAVAQRVLDKELKTNQNLVKFLQEQERNPETRKLDLKSFMNRPTTRLGRYNLLFESIMKYTPEENPDKEILRKALDGIREILKKINEETGKMNSIIRIHDLMDQIVFKSGEFQDLRLNDPQRKLIREGQFKRPSGNSLRVFLFDHVFLLTKEKKGSNGSILYRVYGRPIPLELFAFNVPDSVSPEVADSAKSGFPFCFTHISKRGSTYTLLATSPAERKQWISRIQDQRARRMMERQHVFDIITISDSTFKLMCRINCSTHYTNANHSRKIVIGADDGVYVGIEGSSASFEKVLSLEKIRHIEILEEFQMILVLQDKLLLSYSIDLLDNPKRSVNRYGQKLASHVIYFCAGTLNGCKYVAVMKLKGLKSFCKILEPVEVSKVQGRPKLLCQKNGHALKLVNQLCISSDSNSVRFLKKKLYLVSSKGFEVLDLVKEAHKSIPDPKNERQFAFFSKYEHYKPLAMYRIGSHELLLCYDEFVFYIDNAGQRSRPDFFMEWEGQPTNLAFHYPYLIGFNPSFIEIRNVETGALEQVIETSGLRCLNNGQNKTGIYCVMEPFQSHHQYIFQLRMPARSQPPTNNSAEGASNLQLSDVV
ncbi:RHO1 GDP-GTP exchange protein 2 [Basidiobolus ranarum]|uniref:RHO1 GDP-GTP exchange protein 2 n=1 Tax=Basidiobolus ranarum TaxID=34480 RepID=A0ABR2VYR2_9FUNG